MSVIYTHPVIFEIDTISKEKGYITQYSESRFEDHIIRHLKIIHKIPIKITGLLSFLKSKNEYYLAAYISQNTENNVNVWIYGINYEKDIIDIMNISNSRYNDSNIHITLSSIEKQICSPII